MEGQREKEGEQCYLPSDPALETEKIRYYWLSSDFDKWTNREDVLSFTEQQLPLLNSILKVKYGRRIGLIEIGNLYRADEQGRLILEIVKFPPVAGRRVTSENLLQEANMQDPNITDLVLKAKTNPLVTLLANESNSAIRKPGHPLPSSSPGRGLTFSHNFKRVMSQPRQLSQTLESDMA